MVGVATAAAATAGTRGSKLAPEICGAGAPKVTVPRPVEFSAGFTASKREPASGGEGNATVNCATDNRSFGLVKAIAGSSSRCPGSNRAAAVFNAAN